MSTKNYKQITRGKINANDINNEIPIHASINNADTIDRIARIIVPQITNNPFENDFFNGTRFQENNTLILSADWSSFP
jgi:hypothetical protein